MGLEKKFIGRKYGPIRYEVGREKIAEYARAIKNEDPHYLDENFARTTAYGGIIAPPTFAVVYAGKLIAKGIDPMAACSMTLVRPLTDDPDMRDTLDAAVSTFFG